MNLLLAISTVKEYQALQLERVSDQLKFNEYAITHHSTVIEGSTLTENETRVLLEEGLTPRGKPLVHTMMVMDHYEALQYTVAQARNKLPVNEQLVCEINARVMKGTGSIFNTALGTVDASKGIYRLGNVSAGGSYFPGYDKVPKLMKDFIQALNDKMKAATNPEAILHLAFSAHFNLVSIHPFYDGNGRTSRLLMNYLQEYYGMPLGIVHKEDKSSYFTALQESRKAQSVDPFIEFMAAQYIKFLRGQITEYLNAIAQNRNGGSQGFNLLF